MEKKNRKILYEGKAKILYKGQEPNTIVQYFKDHTTAFNNKKFAIIEGKGVLNNKISAFLMEKLINIDIPTHFIKKINTREQLVYNVEIIPVEFVIRNIAAGSICKRFNLKEGKLLPRTLIEYYYKCDELNDPMISEEHITAFKWASLDELKQIYNMSIKINDFLVKLFLNVGIKVIDFKLEFGRLSKNNKHILVLADELSPDNFRLWDIKTNKKLDKDIFREDLGNIIDAYNEVAQRLGIIK